MRFAYISEEEGDERLLLLLLSSNLLLLLLLKAEDETSMTVLFLAVPKVRSTEPLLLILAVGPTPAPVALAMWATGGLLREAFRSGVAEDAVEAVTLEVAAAATAAAAKACLRGLSTTRAAGDPDWRLRVRSGALLLPLLVVEEAVSAGDWVLWSFVVAFELLLLLFVASSSSSSSLSCREPSSLITSLTKWVGMVMVFSPTRRQRELVCVRRVSLVGSA